METATKKNPFAWRALTSTLIATAFLVLVITGIVLFVSPPGRVANWTNWRILGLRKHEWTAVHVCFSLLFVVTTAAHLFFNWRPLLNYFKDRLTRQLSFRKEWAAAVLICAGIFAGTCGGVAPFSSLMAFNERVKESWEKPAERAPIPHAELLTLSELAANAGVDLTTASNRLGSQGVKGFAAEMVLQKLADDNHRSAQELYQILIAAPRSAKESSESGVHKGVGYGGGYGGGKGGGKGGGPGRKTLSDYCAEEGLDLKDALARLQAKGIKAAADLTLREIAVNNGYSRPYELLDIIKPTDTGH